MSDDTIFSEINEELRKDRMKSGWRRYGVYVIGAAVLLVVGVAGYEGWNWWRTSNATRSSDELFAALKLSDDGNLAGAQAALAKLVTNGSGQYPTLARFKEAALLARQGKTADAQAAYDSLATAEGNPQLRSLALLFAANLLVDKGDVAGVKSRVEGLLIANDPLRGAAEEAIGLAQYKAGDLNAARASFTEVLNDPAGSQQTRQRMQIYLAQLTAQGAAAPGAPATSAAKTSAAPAAETSAAPAAKPATAPAAKPATAPATPAASKPAPAASTEPAGVESNQPMLPDAALQLATPAPPAAPATPATDGAAPTLSTGAGLPTTPDNTAAPVAPAAGTAIQPSGAATAPDAGNSPAAAATPATPAAPAATTPAETVPPATTPAASASGTPPPSN